MFDYAVCRLAPLLRIAAALLIALGGCSALAEADGPDHYRVRPEVAQATMLAAPDENAKLVARLPGGTDGLVNLGCQGGLTLAEWQAASEAERKAGAERRWCRVRHAGLEGWMKGTSLQEGGPPVAARPSFDCAKAVTSAEKMVCAKPALAALDHEVARLYALAHDSLERRSERARTLRAEQRGWIKGRDECWKAGKMLQGCVTDEYVLRIAALRQGYAAARADNSDNPPSTGPFAYDCPGLGAGVSATFVTADPAAGHDGFLALGWGGSQYAMVRVPSASGARYVNRVMGIGFWVKADTALLERPGAPQIACRQGATD